MDLKYYLIFSHLLGDFNRTDNETFLAYNIEYLNRSSLTAWVSDDFDPTNTGGEKLLEGTSYSWNAFGINYASTPKKLLTFDFNSRVGIIMARGYF